MLQIYKYQMTIAFSSYFLTIKPKTKKRALQLHAIKGYYTPLSKQGKYTLSVLHCRKRQLCLNLISVVV